MRLTASSGLVARHTITGSSCVRKLLFFASAVVLVDTSFYAAITPLLPDLTDQFGLSKAGAGVLAAAYPVGTFVGGLPGGWMAARVGVRPTVLLGLTLMTLASVGVRVRATASCCLTSRASSRASAARRRGRARWAGWPARAPREKRGQLIGSAMGAAIAGALFGPVLGVLADVIGHAVVFCGVGLVGIGLIIWTLRTPGVKPVGDGSLGGLWRSLGDGQIRVGLC